MVALASRPASTPTTRQRQLGWTAGAAVVFLVGLAGRLVLAGAGVGDRSATLMTALLAGAVWLAAYRLSTPRTALLALLGAIVLFDLAALPPRGAPEYDDREALYTTDQVVRAQVAVPPQLVAQSSQAVLVVLVEPVFPALDAQPRFGLAAAINGARATWSCAFGRGLQRLALPLPGGTMVGSGPTADVELQLTGSPDRERSYLLIYSSSTHGGPLVSLVEAADAGQTTQCALG